MRIFSKTLRLLPILVFTIVTVSCRDKNQSATEEKSPGVVSAEMAEMNQFRLDTRTLYNNRKYAELETLANELRTEKAKFPSGIWKIVQFYSSLDCREDEPESMWKLHEEIHKEWVTKFPESITAHVAHADFMATYAWQARGSGYANTVTEEGWRLFRERLAKARTILDESKPLSPCPVWWKSRLRVALGEGAERKTYEALYQQAKTLEPQFFAYDFAMAKYLLPRWHGEAGEWEAFAEKEIERPDGLGFEGYARVVNEQGRYHDNVFKESSASSAKAKMGFEEIRKRYPDSKEILNTFCRMAYLARDREQARKLFAEIGDEKVENAWLDGNEFSKAKAWAIAEK